MVWVACIDEDVARGMHVNLLASRREIVGVPYAVGVNDMDILDITTSGIEYP